MVDVVGVTGVSVGATGVEVGATGVCTGVAGVTGEVGVFVGVKISNRSLYEVVGALTTTLASAGAVSFKLIPRLPI